MSFFWRYFFTSPASEQGSPVFTETLATADAGVEPGSSEGPMSLQFDSTTTSDNSSYCSGASTCTCGCAASAGTSVTERSTSNASTAPPAVQDGPHARLGVEIDCVSFDSNSVVGSPTINIDSDDATGSTNNIPDGTFRPQRPPSAMAYPPQITHAGRRERVTYFGPGTVVGSPTINIRSARASGVVDTVIPSRAQAE
ncbi:hypothetical protein EDB19DRAFT_1675576 [Suillus lakei]|nr:hypothetical protein EDB19DRAFT_1675576 [Suillus lakei]